MQWQETLKSRPRQITADRAEKQRISNNVCHARNELIRSPNGKVPVSPADKEILEAYGAAVVECSWARIDEVPMSRIGGRCERLRMIFEDMDVNDSAIPRCYESSQLRQTLAIKLCRSLCCCILYLRYFQRPLELNVGHTDWARQVLSGFSWGHAFFEVNGGLLERYAHCEDADEVGKVQEEWLAQLEREWAESREDKGEQDEWAGGNPNRRADSEDEEDEEEEEESEAEREKHENVDEKESAKAHGGEQHVVE